MNMFTIDNAVLFSCIENKQLWVDINIDTPKHFLTTNINILFRNCGITYVVVSYSIWYWKQVKVLWNGGRWHNQTPWYHVEQEAEQCLRARQHSHPDKNDKNSCLAYQPATSSPWVRMRQNFPAVSLCCLFVISVLIGEFKVLFSLCLLRRP